MFHNAVVGGRDGGCYISREKTLQRCTVPRGWVGVKVPGKNHYITFEWPLSTVWNIKAKMLSISIDTHQLHYIPLHHFIIQS